MNDNSTPTINPTRQDHFERAIERAIEESPGPRSEEDQYAVEEALLAMAACEIACRLVHEETGPTPTAAWQAAEAVGRFAQLLASHLDAAIEDAGQEEPGK